MKYALIASILFVSFKGLLYSSLNLSTEAGTLEVDWGHSWVVPPLVLLVRSFWLSLRRRSLPSIGWAALGFTVLVLANCVTYVASSLSYAVTGFLVWGVWIGLLYWALVEDRCDVSSFLSWLLILIAGCYALGVLYEFATGTTLVRSQDLLKKEFVRYAGLTSSPVHTSLIITIGLLFLAHAFSVSRSSVWRSILGLSAAMMVVGLLLSLGRAALLGALVGLFVMVAVVFRNRVGAIVLSVALLVGSIASVSGFLQENQTLAFLGSALSLSSEDNKLRLETYQSSLERLGADPVALVFGNGAGASGLVAKAQLGDELTTESSVLKLIWDLGLIGLLVAGLAWTTAAKLIIEGLSTKRRSLFGTCLAAFLAMSIEVCVAEVLDSWTVAFAFWSIVAIAAYQRRMLSREEVGSRSAAKRIPGAIGVSRGYVLSMR